MSRKQLSKILLLFSGLILSTLLLIAFTNRHILTTEFYERSSEPVSGVTAQDTLLYQHLQSSVYVGTVIYLTVKIICIVLILHSALFLSGPVIPVTSLMVTAISSEYLFFIPAAFKVYLFNLYFPNGSLQEWHSYYPFSVLSLIPHVPAIWIYPLQTLNIFEIIYWFLLAAGIKKRSGWSFDRSLQVVLRSYVPALVCWIALISLITVILFPQAA